MRAERTGGQPGALLESDTRIESPSVPEKGFGVKEEITRETTITMRSPLTSSRRLVPVSVSASLEEQIKARENEIKKLNLLLDTVDNLGSEPNLESLVALVAKRTSQIMGCERSSVFLLDGQKRELYSLVAEGLESKKLRLPLNEGIAGYVARTGWTLNIPDAYKEERFNPKVDHKTGYHTTSVLAMPLFNRQSQVMGVLQCLNKLGPNGAHVPFERSDEPFLSALTGLVAIFLENAKLYRHMKDLLAAVVSGFSRSIDDRDPCTHGHSRRVTQYALNLARAVHECKSPAFAHVHYTRDRVLQLRYSGLLHDVGKIGVREHVLCKANKLAAGAIEKIEGRLEVIRERKRSELLQRAIEEKKDHRGLLIEEYQPFSKDIDDALAVVRARNTPGFVTDEQMAELKALEERGWITRDECEVLAIRKGNLTPDEWEDIRSHVTKSYQLLRKIPWPRELHDLPEIAYSHHEKRDGSGYPRKIKGDAIHFDGQILCVADIYDALTSSDRPYKKAMPHDRARKILVEEEGAKNKIMPELVNLFFEKKCYIIEETAAQLGVNKKTVKLDD